MKNGNESRKWKLRSIQKSEKNSRNITKIDNWTLKKKRFVRLRDELTVKKVILNYAYFAIRIAMVIIQMGGSEI